MNSEIGRKRRDLLDMEGNPASLNMTEILWVPKPAEIGRSDSEEEDTVRSEEEDFDRSEVFDSEFSLRSKEEAEERFKFLVKIPQKYDFLRYGKSNGYEKTCHVHCHSGTVPVSSHSVTCDAKTETWSPHAPKGKVA